MSILDKLKDSVFETDTKPPARETHTELPPLPKPVASANAIDPPDAGLLADLRRKVDPQEPSALKVFTHTLESLSAVIPDQKTRWQAAQVALGTSGRRLADDINESLSRLDKEVSTFETAKRAKVSEDVAGRQQRLIEVDRQIQVLQSEKSSISTELKTAQSAIEVRAKQFGLAVSDTRNYYADLLKKIETFLETN